MRNFLFDHADVRVVDGRNKIRLLVREDKRYWGIGDPESQLIAQAIAAFQDRNRRLSLAFVRGSPAEPTMMMPEIIALQMSRSFLESLWSALRRYFTRSL
jgi:hypothetical protein